MGRYSRKDMIEFAKFAKSYQSPSKVDNAYDAYLSGERLISKYTNEEKKRQIKKLRNERRIRRQNEKKLREQNKSSVTS